MDEADLVANMVKQNKWPTNAVLVVHELCRFASNSQIESVSFVIRRGQCFGILGLQGSGKSELIRILTGTSVFDDGNFYLNKFDDMPIRYRKQYDGISCAPQFNCYHELLTVEEMLMLFAKIRRVEEKHIWTEVQRVGRIFKLESHFKTFGNILDRFTQRAVTLAMAFIGGPSLVIIDEPNHQVCYSKIPNFDKTY